MWRGMSLFPKTQVLKDFFNHLCLVNKTDVHLTLTLGTDEGICLVDLSNKVGPALF